jgi:mannose-6-phosphate isomerase
MAKNAEKFEERPWGTFEILGEFSVTNKKNGEPIAEDVVIKKITIRPGQKISYQFHNQEFWTIIQGQGILTLDETQAEIKMGDQVHIPTEIKHRLENNQADADLVFMEVGVGDYDENDITRLEDNYGRV